MINNPRLRIGVYILAVPFVGFILLNLAFAFVAAFQSFIDLIFSPRFEWQTPWYPPFRLAISIAIILIISWFILKSDIADIYKATFSVVPFASILVVIGMALHRMPILSFTIGALAFGATVFYLYKTKKAWVYYYAISLVALALTIMGILRVEI